MNTVYKKMDRMQASASNKIMKALEENGRALLVSATGTGKTEIAAKIIKKQATGTRILWISHQNELMEQVSERLIERLNADVSLFNGQNKDKSSQIVVASVQSISRPENLKKFSRNEFDLLFVDECHHAPAETWGRTIDYFRANKVGMTATYKRPDGLSVNNIFGDPVFNLSFEDAQNKGFLAKDWNRVILTNSAIEGFVGQGKEYTEKQLEKLYTSEDRNKIIIDSYLRYGRRKVKSAGMNPKAVCFCINVQHAIRMSEMFNRNGIVSSFMCGDTKYQTASEREKTMEIFRNSNAIEILCVVNIFNEGIDIPEANIGLMARPTRSNIIYQQQVGRIARSNGGNKSFFIVLDFVDVTRQEYSGYIMGNLKKGKLTHNKVVAIYLKDRDPVMVNQRVENIMASVREFEKLMDVKVTEENKYEHLKALSEGKILKIRDVL